MVPIGFSGCPKVECNLKSLKNTQVLTKLNEKSYHYGITYQ